MDAEEILAPEGAVPLGRSRADVLDMLRAADGPLGVRDVARRTGLHPNTARFHLEALAEAGLAVRETQERNAPGRPRIGYQASGDAPAGSRRYRLLAEMLAGLITATATEPARAAEEAGREWGAYLTEQPPPYARPSAAESVRKLTATLADMGFAPATEAAADEGERPPAGTGGGVSGGYVMRLRQCPFREVAEHHQDVVCPLHLGLMRGALARMRAPVTADELEPFAEPGLCVARLTASPDPGK
jgi:predicted ArsR family transcriptional regulator